MKKWKLKRKRDHFGGKMILCNLKNSQHYIKHYIDLRNQNKEQLLTDSISEDETILWLNSANVCVKVAIENDELIGAAILYFDKAGEVAIFVKHKRSGVGTALLKEIQVQAQNENIKNLWAWVSNTNIASKKLFEKNKFNADMPCSRVFAGINYYGIIYKMEII